eukprot:GHVP01057001.1.p1 GENE.GHVP01057001.1~~GHVP01057001.1.p1  ORF type:complete len:580 (-),score=124.61 GHVP01057001.1:63-1802(-)
MNCMLVSVLQAQDPRISSEVRAAVTRAGGEKVVIDVLKKSEEPDVLLECEMLLVNMVMQENGGNSMVQLNVPSILIEKYEDLTAKECDSTFKTLYLEHLFRLLFATVSDEKSLATHWTGLEVEKICVEAVLNLENANTVAWAVAALRVLASGDKDIPLKLHIEEVESPVLELASSESFAEDGGWAAENSLGLLANMQVVEPLVTKRLLNTEGSWEKILSLTSEAKEQRYLKVFHQGIRCLGLGMQSEEYGKEIHEKFREIKVIDLVESVISGSDQIDSVDWTVIQALRAAFCGENDKSSKEIAVCEQNLSEKLVQKSPIEDSPESIDTPISIPLIISPSELEIENLTSEQSPQSSDLSLEPQSSDLSPEPQSSDLSPEPQSSDLSPEQSPKDDEKESKVLELSDEESLSLIVLPPESVIEERQPSQIASEPPTALSRSEDIDANTPKSSPPKVAVTEHQSQRIVEPQKFEDARELDEFEKQELERGNGKQYQNIIIYNDSFVRNIDDTKVVKKTGKKRKNRRRKACFLYCNNVPNTSPDLTPTTDISQEELKREGEKEVNRTVVNISPEENMAEQMGEL